jgi:hypothetical protein
VSTYTGTVDDSGNVYRGIEATDAEHAAEEIAELHCSAMCEWPEDGTALRVYVLSPDGVLSAHDVYAERTIYYTAHAAEGVPLAVARLLGGAV